MIIESGTLQYVSEAVRMGAGRRADSCAFRRLKGRVSAALQLR